MAVLTTKEMEYEKRIDEQFQKIIELVIQVKMINTAIERHGKESTKSKVDNNLIVALSNIQKILRENNFTSETRIITDAERVRRIMDKLSSFSLTHMICYYKPSSAMAEVQKIIETCD